MNINNKKNFNNKFKHLKIKYKQDPKKYLVFITSLILMFSFVIGSSYAVLTYVSKTENSTTVEFGTVALNFYNETNEISLDGAIPQENSEAIKNNKEYEFTVKNDGSVTSTFELTLDNTCSLDKKYKINNKSVKADKCIPNEYIKVALREGDSKYEVIEQNIQNDKYVLDADHLAPGETRNYKMKVWLDYDTPNDYNPGTDKLILYSGKLNVNYEQGDEYEENAYVIRYNANGGTGTMSDEEVLSSGTTTIKTNEFTRTGYTFKGYSYEKDGEIVYQGGESITNLTNLNAGIVNLYAIWEANTYTVVYNANGGTGTMENTSHIYDQEKPLPRNTFTNGELVFAGWSTSETSQTVRYKDGELVKNLTATNEGTVNLYAVYTEDSAEQHTIVYKVYASCGTGTMENTSFYGSTVTLPEITYTPVVGYHFVGWDTDSSATNVVYEDGATVENIAEPDEETIRLYAVCAVNEYKFEYYSYDGTTKYGESTHKYNVSSTLTAITTLGGTAPSDKVTFYGWSTSENATTRTYANSATISKLNKEHGSVTKLYAVWRSSAVTLTWISGLNQATKTTTGPYYYYNNATGVKLTTPASTEISGWENPGWRNDTTAGAKEWTTGYSNTYSVSATYYAIYTKLHTVNFYSGVSKATTIQKTATAYYNSSAETLTTRVNVVFPAASECTNITNWTELGWRNDTTAGASEYAFGSTNATLLTTTSIYATYSRTLTISYDGNTATSGSTSNTTKTVYMNTNSTTTSSQAVTLRSNGFAKTGYSFSKWAAGSTSGTQYASGASYTPGVAYNAATFGKTMYAIWTIKSKAITFKIAYDTSTYSGPSSGYSTSTYQKISKTSATLNYGGSTTLTTSPAFPDDRYTGSVSCTNGITATIATTSGAGTTSRTDTTTVKNNSDTTSASVCTITYTPKWQGIAKGSYTAGKTLSAGYGNTTYTWTIVSDNTDNVGLAYNATNSSGSYSSAGSTLTTNFLNAYSILKNDAAKGGLIKQGSYYISTDSGISTNLTADIASYNYWVGSGKFYNRLTRNRYDRVLEKFVRGHSNGRSNNVTTYSDFTLYSAYTDYTTTKIIAAGIRSTSGTNYSINTSTGEITFTKASFDSSATETTDSRYSNWISEFEIVGGSDNALWFVKNGYKLNSSWEWVWQDAWSSDSIIKNTYRTTHWICGGDYDSKKVTYRYKELGTFYYGNQATGTGWPSTNDSFVLADGKVYDIYEGDYFWEGNYAGNAGTDCGSTRNNCPESSDQTIGGYTRYHRYYHYNNYDSYAYCFKRKKYTDTPANYTVTLHYRPYIIVRER